MERKERFGPKQESLILSSPDSVKDIAEYFAFADPLIGVDWGEEGPLEEYTPEFIFAHPELTQVFVIRNTKGEIVAGAKVKKLDTSEKERLGLTDGELATKEGALLEYTAVKEAYRNNRLLADLTQKRIEWARSHESEYVCSEAEITNPISVYTKIRDGFTLIGIREPVEGIPEPYFVEYKNLDSIQNAVSTPDAVDSELKEIMVSKESYAELADLFAHGWVGIDIKGSPLSPEKLEMPWTLILSRTAVQK
jgi:hypothetical protein